MGGYKNDQTTLLNRKPSNTINALYKIIERLEAEIESLKKDLEERNSETLKSSSTLSKNKEN